MNLYSRIVLFFICCMLIQKSLYAGNENFPVGGRALGMANASVTIRDFWSLQQNQAGIAAFKGVAAGIYVENRFQLSDLSLKAAGIILPVVKNNIIGLTVVSFGNSLYSERKVGLAYARNIADKVYAAVQLDYLNTTIGENYGSKNSFVGEAGIQAQLSQVLRVGAHIYNPSKTALAVYNDERIPTIMKAGFSYNFSDKVLLVLEGEGELGSKPYLKAGLEYHPVKQAYFRTGVSNNFQAAAFGAGFDFKVFKFDVGASLHQTLGFTTGISVVFTKQSLPAF